MAAKIKKEGSKSEILLEFQLGCLNAPRPQREFMFDTENKRKWRFDFAWPEKKLAVECEGVTSYGKSLGRHQTAKGYSADLDKYNAATMQGWHILRFNQEHVKSGQAVSMIMVFLAAKVENPWHKGMYGSADRSAINRGS